MPMAIPGVSGRGVRSGQWGGRWTWVDLLWLVFLAGLAVLPPVAEVHKQLILLGFGLFQLFEGQLMALLLRRGPVLAVGVKIGLAAPLIGHTGEVAINSSYYPIFYVPVVTAAMLFGPWGTLGWTAVATGAYLSYLWPALNTYRLDVTGRDELALRVFFFFLLALIINRFVEESRSANRRLQEAQALQRRAERLAALGQLSAGLAHEIRNPLAVIKGSAEMLERHLDASQAVAVELAGYISSEVNRVNQLVGRFLDFARPLRLDRQPQAVAALLDRAIADARERWPELGVTVHRDYAELPPIAVDETLCERAFANLVANAFEAMAETGGEVTVTARRGMESGASGVTVVVADTGPGVPGELREQIFHPFFTTKPTGIGLGLAIVAKIIDQHGGRLRLHSGLPRGAAFE